MVDKKISRRGFIYGMAGGAAALYGCGGGGIYSVQHFPELGLMLAACDMNEAYRSTDNGKTWNIINNFYKIHLGPDIMLLNTAQGRALVWPCKGVDAGTARVAVSWDTGVTWENTEFQSPNVKNVKYYRNGDQGPATRYNSHMRRPL